MMKTLILSLMMTMTASQAMAAIPAFKFTPADCNTKTDVLEGNLRKAIYDFFESVSSPVNVYSIMISETDVNPRDYINLDYLIARKVTFATSKTEIPLSLEFQTNYLFPEQTVPAIFFYQGILEVYDQSGKRQSKDCIWGIPDAGFLLMFKDVTTGEALVKFTAQFRQFLGPEKMAILSATPIN